MNQVIIKIRIESNKIGKHGEAMEHVAFGERTCRATIPLAILRALHHGTPNMFISQDRSLSG